MDLASMSSEVPLARADYEVFSRRNENSFTARLVDDRVSDST